MNWQYIVVFIIFFVVVVISIIRLFNMFRKNDNESVCGNSCKCDKFK